jgi:O-antigen/teichoic acid export membrane protein
MLLQNLSNRIDFGSWVNSRSSHSLFSNAFALVSSNLLTAFSGYLFWIIAARRFDEELVGVGSAVISSVASIELLTNLGLGAALIRFLPGAQKESGRDRYVNVAFTARLGAALITIILFLLGLDIFAAGLSVLTAQPVLALVFVLLVVSNGFFTLLASLFIALRKSRYVLVMSVTYNVMKVLLALFSALSLGLLSLMNAFLIPIVFSILLSGSIFRSRSGSRYIPALSFGFREHTDFFAYAISNYFADAFVALPYLLMPVLILNRLGPQSAAHFYPALMIAGLLRTASASISQSTFAEGAAKPEDLYKYLRSSLWLSLLTVLILGALIAIFAPWLLHLFGHHYAQEGVIILPWLLLSALPYIVLNVWCVTAFRIQKNIKFLIWISLTWSLFSLSGAAAGMQTGGLKGAVMGWLVGQSAAVLLSIAFAVPERLKRRQAIRT